MSVFRFAVLAVALCLLIPKPTQAQLVEAPSDSLRGMLRDTMTPLGSPQTVSALVALSSLEVATAPLGTSTGGFTFTFDPLVRVYRREAHSFGPAFGQRSLTTGKGKISVGANFLRASYDSLGGYDLRDGSFLVGKNIQAEALPFSSTSATVRMSSNTVVGFAQFGLTDSIDVGVVVPWVRMSLSLDGTFVRPSGESIPSPPAPVVQIDDVSSSGFGDIALYGKAKLFERGDGGIAAAVEVRLPTGDKNELRGLDVTRTLISAIWSKGGRVSPHANIGYEFWSAGVPVSAEGDVAAKNQLKYAAGLEFDATPHLTVLLDVVGRRLFDGGKIGYRTFSAPGGTAELLVGLNEGIDAMAIAPGVKWNVWRNLLITGNVLATVKNDGLRSRWIPVVGVDFAF